MIYYVRIPKQMGGITTKILYATSMSLEKEKNLGNKIHFVEIGKALKKLGHQIILVAPYYKNQGTKEAYGLIDEQIDFKKKNITDYLLYHQKLRKKLPSLIKKYKPDLFYSRDLLNVKSLNKILKKNQIKHFVEINDLISDYEFEPKFAKPFFLKIQETQIKNADLIRVMTQQIKEKLQKDYPETNGKVYIIRHGTDPEIFKDRGKFQSQKKTMINNKFIFCFIGTYNYMAYINGLKYFLSALKKFIANDFQDTHLILIGEGKFTTLLEEEISRLGIKNNVTLTGTIQNEKLPDYISASDICLQTWIPEKKDVEGLSLKLSSYLACERRILTSDLKGFREILEPFDTLFWKLEDEESMYQCIKKAYKEKDSWDKGKTQRQYVIENFTWEIAAKKIIEAFIKNK